MCDDDRATGLDPNETQECTVDNLTGTVLRCEELFGDRSCLCFETDPYANEDVPNAKRRFFLYRTIALELGATGRRVDLPLCVKEKVEELYDQSRTGFRDNCHDASQA